MTKHDLLLRHRYTQRLQADFGCSSLLVSKKPNNVESYNNNKEKC